MEYTLPEPHDILQHLHIVATPEIQKNTMEFNTMEFNTMSNTPRALRSSAAPSYRRCPCNTIQCNAMEHNTMQWNTIQCPTLPEHHGVLYHFDIVATPVIQYNAMEYNTKQWNAMEYNTMWNSQSPTEFCSTFISSLLLSYNTMQWNPVQYNGTGCSTIHYDEIKCNRLRHNTMSYSPSITDLWNIFVSSLYFCKAYSIA